MTNINIDIRLSTLELIKLVIVHLPTYLPTFYLEVHAIIHAYCNSAIISKETLIISDIT